MTVFSPKSYSPYPKSAKIQQNRRTKSTLSRKRRRTSRIRTNLRARHTNETSSKSNASVRTINRLRKNKRHKTYPLGDDLMRKKNKEGGYPAKKIAPVIKCVPKGKGGKNKIKPNNRKRGDKPSKALLYQMQECSKEEESTTVG